MEAFDVEAIERAERARCAATLASSCTALDALLADDLQFVHSSGYVHDKAAYLAFLSESVRTLRIHRPGPPTFTAMGRAVLVRGPVDQTLERRADASLVEVRSHTTQIWMPAEDGWRLLHQHSTRRADISNQADMAQVSEQDRGGAEASSAQPLPAPPAEHTTIHITAAGGPDVLQARRVPVPTCGPQDVLIAVVSAGVNRHDINQRRRGPDAVHSPIPGLEVSGRIAAIGKEVRGLKPGDAVCALVNGGGYAEFALAHSGQVLPVPAGMALEDAAALPEALFTAWYNFFDVAKLAQGEQVLIHGGTSGVGTIAIQMLAAMGFTVYATCGSDEKCAMAERLGARRAFNYRQQSFETEVMEVTGGRGVDVILDMAGTAYGHQNVAALARRGRIVHLSPGTGRDLSVPLRDLMRKEGVVTGSLLRPVSDTRKAGIAAALHQRVWPMIGQGIVPVIAARFTLPDAKLAHAALEGGELAGKVLLDGVSGGIR